MNRLYYDRLKDSSFKFIYWDWFQINYQLFDPAVQTSFTGHDTVLLSMTNSDNESLAQPERAQLATVSSIPHNKALQAFFSAEIQDYDLNSNRFTKQIVSESENINFFNTFQVDIQDGIELKKFNLLNAPLSENYRKRGSYWNNDFNFYNDFTSCLLQNNTLVVDQMGKIRRMPGGVVTVKIDRDVPSGAYESQNVLDDAETRFHGLEGLWFSSRIHTYIYPRESRFRQGISLMRNFTVSMDNS